MVEGFALLGGECFLPLASLDKPVSFDTSLALGSGVAVIAPSAGNRFVFQHVAGHFPCYRSIEGRRDGLLSLLLAGNLALERSGFK